MGRGALYVRCVAYATCFVHVLCVLCAVCCVLRVLCVVCCVYFACCVCAVLRAVLCVLCAVPTSEKTPVGWLDRAKLEHSSNNHTQENRKHCFRC